MTNFNNIVIIKQLGIGAFGTTYLCKYEGHLYVMKIQHILKKSIKDYNCDIWREIDLYKYIDKMPKKHQVFFTKLYDYKIYNNCTHKQIRPIGFHDEKLIQKFKELDESDYCINYLLEYKGESTLSNFLVKYRNKLKLEQIYSILAQVINIIKILYSGGYSHNDLHCENIMINKTNNIYFIMNNKKIKYYGIQLSAIDYGRVFHSKYKLKYTKLFYANNKQWLFKELFNTLIDKIKPNIYLRNYCNNINEKLPAQKNLNYYYDGIKLIFENHIDFCNKEVNKYIELFPQGRQTTEHVFKFHKILEIKEIEKQDYNFMLIINRLIIEFELKHPKLYKNYFGWCSETQWLLPKNECLQILLINNTTDLINYFINKNSTLL